MALESLPRQLGYRIFASLYLYPEQERLEAVQTLARELLEEEASNDSSAGSALLKRLAGLDLETERREVVNEYNRLFLVRPKAPPHETFYTDPDGQFRGMQTAQLEETYRAAGLAVSDDLNELPDHIAVELEFMSYLCGKEAAALEANDREEANRFLALQKDFMGKHLARWFPRMAKRVIEAEPVVLFDAVNRAAFSFLRNELDYLGMSPKG